MTVIFEVSNPFQFRPWKYRSGLMYRCGWLWFAVCVLRIPFKDFCLTQQEWEST